MNFDQQLELLIKNALAEDIGDGDHSTMSTIDDAAAGKAVLKIKEDGILAGMDVAEKIFRHMEPGIIFTAFKKERGGKGIPGSRNPACESAYRY